MYLNERLQDKFTENWAGDYNSSIGRFISEDRVGFESGDSNLSRYVKNNPIFFVDPSGEALVTGIVAGIGFVSFGFIVYIDSEIKEIFGKDKGEDVTVGPNPGSAPGNAAISFDYAKRIINSSTDEKFEGFDFQLILPDGRKIDAKGCLLDLTSTITFCFQELKLQCREVNNEGT